MCGEHQGHLVPTDVDIWMVIHELRLMPDLIHEVQGRDKVSQLVRRGNRRVIAIGTAPVRKSRQLLGHLESVNSGLIPQPRRGRGGCQEPRQFASIASTGTTGVREKEPMVAIPERIKRLEQQPWIAHIMRAVERYISRLGSQFAAATTYFWVLALVPILMVAFSITGFVLTVVYPDLLDNVADASRTPRQRGPGHPRQDLES